MIVASQLFCFVLYCFLPFFSLLSLFFAVVLCVVVFAAAAVEAIVRLNAKQ